MAKLTNSEIVKALECCANYKNTKCKGCPLEESCVDNNICGLALDLINRLQAENKHYSHNVKEMTDSIRNYQKALEQAKAENERFKKILGCIYTPKIEIPIDKLEGFLKNLGGDSE